MARADRPKLAAAVTPADEASTAETTPATSLAPFATVVTRLPIVAGAQTTAGKSSCVGDTRTEGNCVSVKLRKPRMVWVANNRPAIAAVALGRSAAPTTGSMAMMPVISSHETGHGLNGKCDGIKILPG